MSASFAVCLTPDALYFRPAVFTAASLLAQDDSEDLDVILLCEEKDVAPGFDRLDPPCETGSGCRSWIGNASLAACRRAGTSPRR